MVCTKLIDENHEDSEEFGRLIEELLDHWQALKDAMDDRRTKLGLRSRDTLVGTLQGI